MRYNVYYFRPDGSREPGSDSNVPLPPLGAEDRAEAHSLWDRSVVLHWDGQQWLDGPLLSAPAPDTDDDEPTTATVVGYLPNGRELRRTPRGTFEVQARGDNYWVEAASIQEALREAGWSADAFTPTE